MKPRTVTVTFEVETAMTTRDIKAAVMAAFLDAKQVQTNVIDATKPRGRKARPPFRRGRPAK